jgi:hypothetical protein
MIASDVLPNHIMFETGQVRRRRKVVKKMVAYCTGPGPKCTNSHSIHAKGKTVQTGVIKKNARPDTSFCPDCGHALYWKVVIK